MNKLKKDAKKAGNVVKSARVTLENTLNSSIISNQNHLELTQDEFIKNK